MHSRIFVLDMGEGTRELDEEEVYEMMQSYIGCDYVVECERGSESERESIEWLNKTYPVHGNCLMNTKINRENYLMEKYNKVREEMDKGFMNFCEKEFTLRSLINDRYGFYVIIDDCLYTLDDFIFMNCNECRDHDGYEIVQVFDYHV